MNIRKFSPTNLGIDVNTIGAVLGILAVIAAIVGGVVGSGALNDQSGSSRGASFEMIEAPANKPAPSQPEAAVEQPVEAEIGEDYLSPTVRENSKHFEELSRQVEESIRRQKEIQRQSEELAGQADDYLRQAEEAIRLREEAGLY
ncbi:hypothetical protein ACUY2A_02105 [Corynebacterium pilbarense]